MKIKATYILTLFTFLFFCISFNAEAQRGNARNIPQEIPQTDSLIAYEKKLKVLGDSILDGSNETVRIQATQQFIPLLVKTLQFTGSFDYPFESLTFMNKLVPSDKAFRLYNWNLSLDDGKFRYYGAIQMNNTEKFTLFPLFDMFDKKAELADTIEAMELTNQNWYGAQYYQVIANTHRRNTFYTLIGWDGNNRMSTRKLIDILHFEDGKPKFGAPVINYKDTVKHRHTFEFSNEAVMLLRYEADHDIIVYDHLVPSSPAGKGQRFTYVPDGTYDYFIFRRGMWVQREDLFGTFRKRIGSD